MEIFIVMIQTSIMPRETVCLLVMIYIYINKILDLLRGRNKISWIIFTHT